MKYCTRCIMPDTKPDLTLDAEGVCSACRNYENRASVDWKARKKELIAILEKHRGANYDCIIPVSGGKDSHFQVLTILELGFKPLCVTATTCDLTPVGRHNIENIKNLGVDYIEYTADKKIRRKLNRIGLERVGDISWPEHVSIFTIPVQLAVAHSVPLIVWGENSQNEYGGPAADSENPILNRKWLEEFGGLNGLRVSDVIGLDGITERDMTPYIYPTDAELEREKVTGIFLGYYVPWDGRKNAMIAKNYGFMTVPGVVEGSTVDYENLDNHQTGIHDFFKFLKFGFGRATDLLCSDIRRGRITREEALRIAEKRDGLFPHEYLGKNLLNMLMEIGMKPEDFMRVCEQYRNKKLIDEQFKLKAKRT